MDEFKVKLTQVRDAVSQNRKLIRELEDIQNDLGRTWQRLRFKIAQRERIDRRLYSLSGELNREERSMKNVTSALEEIAGLYTAAEQGLCGKKTSLEILFAFARMIDIYIVGPGNPFRDRNWIFPWFPIPGWITNDNLVDFIFDPDWNKDKVVSDAFQQLGDSVREKAQDEIKDGAKDEVKSLLDSVIDYAADKNETAAVGAFNEANDKSKISPEVTLATAGGTAAANALHGSASSDWGWGHVSAEATVGEAEAHARGSLGVLGAEDSIGVSVSLEIDVSGTIDAVADGAKAVWSGITDFFGG